MTTSGRMRTFAANAESLRCHRQATERRSFMAHIKLSEAYLCIDCETIGSNPEYCMVCLSKAVHPIAKFLNRPDLAHTCADRPNLPCEACEMKP
jgi:hypothetical protein